MIYIYIQFCKCLCGFLPSALDMRHPSESLDKNRVGVTSSFKSAHNNMNIILSLMEMKCTFKKNMDDSNEKE